MKTKTASPQPGSPSADSDDPREVADLAAAMLTNGYLTGHVTLLDGGIHPR